MLAEDKLKNPESLEVAKELLTSATPLKAELDRNLQVFRSSPRVTHFDLPNEFYKLGLDEIKREQKLRQVDCCNKYMHDELVQCHQMLQVCERFLGLKLAFL